MLKFRSRKGGRAITGVDPASVRRRWRFATAEFDEASWMLLVDGAKVPMETKPLQLLQMMLERPGELVLKERMLDAVWPGVTVVEGSLSTAVLKLRRALGDHAVDTPIIETVRGMGYRLAAPVELLPVESPAPIVIAARASAPRGHRRASLSWGVGVALTTGLVTAGWLAHASMSVAVPSVVQPLAMAPESHTREDIKTALRELDVPRVERMIRAGWNPDAPLDDQGNNAINIALNICEWDPHHDQRRLLLLVRTLSDAGAKIDAHNVWGDTAYSIAKAKRYCGPDHPVTRMLHTACYNGFNPPRDKCLARRD